MLEWVGAQIGLKVVLTPKCHPELAGEGIEYIWGMYHSCNKDCLPDDVNRSFHNKTTHLVMMVSLF